jgi:signal transduction histidine kinase/CheY-like chemotaxis protein
MRFETRHIAKNGRIFPVEVLTNYFEFEGRFHACAFDHDISERKRAEAEKEKLHAQLLHAQKMESVGRLAGGIAHDFNNMLGVILGNVELALEEIDAEDPLHADLDEIRKAAQRSSDLTRQLLAFARKQTIAPRVLDLNEAISGMLTMLKRLIGEDIDLVWLPGEDLSSVKMDPSQLDQILANLSVNARDAISGNGKVTIETGNFSFDDAYCADHPGYVPGSYVMMAVSDNGCGMSKEVSDHIFEPFFTTKSMGEGTGLGLATVYGIIRQNDGFINVYSEPGRGTTFRISLPVYAEKVSLDETALTADYVGGKETILLVEDEEAILRLGKRLLERFGYRVLAAGTPGEALNLAEQYTGEIDLLMTDIIMPEMNGRELAATMHSRHPELKCLYTSGYTDNVIARHGVLEEGLHFIQKPYSMKDLADKVREALEK